MYIHNASKKGEMIMTKKLTAWTLILTLIMSILALQITTFADSSADLDLSVLSEMDENTSQTQENYSYTWKVEEVDGDTVRTLELTLNGANIKTLTLPCKSYGKINVIINTASDSVIEEIGESYVFSYSYQWNSIIFGGAGALEIGSVNLQGGGNDHVITVSKGASVSITGDYSDLSFGASGSSNSSLFVDGTLSVNGNVYCGNVKIGEEGYLICKRVKVSGHGAADTNDYADAFVLEDGGKLEAIGDTAWCDDATGEYYAALVVSAQVESEDADTVIVLPDGYLPSGFSIAGSEYYVTIDNSDENPPKETSMEYGIIYGANIVKLGFTAEKYTIIFEDEDGTELQSEELEYGDTPVYKGTTPQKAADAEYTYTFDGWTPDIEEVTGEATYTATYTKTLNKYTIIFEDEDGTELQSEELEYGETPVYKGTTPQKAADAEYTYTFDGWTPDIEEVTSAQTYTAVFKAVPVSTSVHIVEFDTSGADDIADVSVTDAEKLTKPQDPVRNGYIFKGWFTNKELTDEYDFENAVVSSFTLYAKWEKKQSSGSGGGGGGTSYCTIEFETDDGSGTEKKRIAYNSKLKKPEDPTKDGYTFEGWYIDEKLETPYDFDTRVKKGFTLYAKWRQTNTSGALNTKEHFAYIKGYGDNTVRPDNYITRAETAEVFFRLLEDSIRDKNLSNENSFTDTDRNAWYNTSVSTLKKLEIVKGITSDLFRPDAYITRGEFAAICARFDNSDFEVTTQFSDVAGHWAEAEIAEAAAHGWIKGYEDGSFRPDEFITRAEAITLINRMTGRTPQKKEDLHKDMIKWIDNGDENAWYYIAVQEATNGHDYIRTAGGERWTKLKAE